MRPKLANLATRRPIAEAREIAHNAAELPSVGKNPYRVGTASRRLVPVGDGAGYEDLVHISDGLYLLACNRLSHTDQLVNFVGEGALKLHFRLSGRSTILLHDGAEFQIDGAYCGVMLHPDGLAKGEIDHGGIAERWATVFCRSDFLRDSLGVEVDEMPAPLRRFVNGQSFDLFARALPLTPMMSHALTALLESRMTGALRNVQAEGQCLDLVSQVLDVLRKNATNSANVHLFARDAEKIRHAREILEREFAHPPTLQALARRVGINQNKLNQGFRTLFGITAGDFVTEMRMRHAHRLLQDGLLNVSQVAYAVGYEFPGNFTTAFKRYFGVVPRSTRAPANAD